MSDFTMPSLGADMEAGTLVEWLVQPGQEVHRGDVVAVIETQKGAIEIEIFDSGVIDEICVPVGEAVPVGTVLARLDGHRDQTEAPPVPFAAPAPPVEAPPAPQPVQPRRPTVTDRVRASPAARMQAAKLGIELTDLSGSGVGGAVVLDDLKRQAPQAKPPPARRQGFDPAAMREAIGAAMARSKREIPHYYLTQTCDVGRALAWLEETNAARSVSERLLPAALFLKAVALALRQVPELNGAWQNGGFRPGPGIHVGWAVALKGGGLVAPAIHDADRLSLGEVMRAMRDLVGRARKGGLRGSELSDGTITVTSLGERGAQSVIGVIYPPQVALVGIGRIATRPWVVEGRLAARPLIDLSLAADHRVSDGARGGRLLALIDRLLQEPEKL